MTNRLYPNLLKSHRLTSTKLLVLLFTVALYEHLFSFVVVRSSKSDIDSMVPPLGHNVLTDLNYYYYYPLWKFIHETGVHTKIRKMYLIKEIVEGCWDVSSNIIKGVKCQLL